jgi:ribosomal protein L37AE/L43A
MPRIELRDKCPKCGKEAIGHVYSNSFEYIATKGLYGGTEILKCSGCKHEFHSSTYSLRIEE